MDLLKDVAASRAELLTYRPLIEMYSIQNSIRRFDGLCGYLSQLLDAVTDRVESNIVSLFSNGIYLATTYKLEYHTWSVADVYTNGALRDKLTNLVSLLARTQSALSREYSQKRARQELNERGFFLRSDMTEVLAPDTLNTLRQYCDETYVSWAKYRSNSEIDAHGTATIQSFSLEVVDGKVTSASPGNIENEGLECLDVPQCLHAVASDIACFLPPLERFRLALSLVDDFGGCEPADRKEVEAMMDIDFCVERATPPLLWHQDSNALFPNAYLFFVVIESSGCPERGCIQVGLVPKANLRAPQFPQALFVPEEDDEYVSVEAEAEDIAGAGYLIKQDIARPDGRVVVHSRTRMKFVVSNFGASVSNVRLQSYKVRRTKLIVRVRRLASKLE